MTISFKNTILAALALTLSLTAAPRVVAAQTMMIASGNFAAMRTKIAPRPIVRPLIVLTIGLSGQASAQNNALCGDRDYMVM